MTTLDPAYPDKRSERIEHYCELMHDAYERAAVGAGWETQQASRKPWADVPEANKATMRAAVAALLDAVEGEISQRLAECGARGRFGLQVVQHLDDCSTS